MEIQESVVSLLKTRTSLSLMYLGIIPGLPIKKQTGKSGIEPCPLFLTGSKTVSTLLSIQILSAEVKQ